MKDKEWWNKTYDELEKEIWNRAIEAVLNLSRIDEYAAVEIRKLKK